MSRLYKYATSVFIVALCCCLQQCSAQQSSTVRPYKFGFTIDEQQHRQEKRDERGIVMGEFGFITADGIYHVTVYATDEQGRFRILAMRNFPYESPPKTVEIVMTPKVVQTTTARTTTPKAELPRHNFYNEACSGCFLSNGNNKPKGQGETPKTEIRTLSKPLPNSPLTPPKTNVQTTNSAAKPNSAAGKSATDTATNKQQGQTPKQTTSSKTPTGQRDIMDIIVRDVLPAAVGSKGVVSSPPTMTAPSGKGPSKSFTPTGSGKVAGNSGKGPSKSFTPTGTGKASANSGSNVYGKGNANPKSSAGGDGDLYRFKYTLDYQGHSETGKRNGNKEGNYFAIGDDDIERTIDYVANENGYQPRIHWRKLNQPKASLPQVNTLKDYEFVWFTQN